MSICSCSSCKPSSPARRRRGVNYRFSITYGSEARRMEWVRSDVHQEVWPTLQAYLTSDRFDFLLFDVI